MADQRGKSSRDDGVGRRPTSPEEEHPAGDAGHVCSVAFCPIGLALSAARPMKPDAIEHLLVAGRELLLAVGAMLDARADEIGDRDAPSALEKIDIA